MIVRELNIALSQDKNPSIADQNRVDKLNGDGFHTWQTKVKFVLIKKGIWGAANGKEKKPTTPEMGELLGL